MNGSVKGNTLLVITGGMLETGRGHGANFSLPRPEIIPFFSPLHGFRSIAPRRKCLVQLDSKQRSIVELALYLLRAVRFSKPWRVISFEMNYSFVDRGDETGNNRG